MQRFYVQYAHPSGWMYLKKDKISLTDDILEAHASLDIYAAIDFRNSCLDTLADRFTNYRIVLINLTTEILETY